MYCCPICKKPVSSEIRRLIWHLRNVHSLSDGQDYTLFCSQNGCQRSYHNINSFSKHLAREHSSEDSLLCMANQLSERDGSDNGLDTNTHNSNSWSLLLIRCGKEGGRTWYNFYLPNAFVKLSYAGHIFYCLKYYHYSLSSVNCIHIFHDNKCFELINGCHWSFFFI